jgi:hypothetical protein
LEWSADVRFGAHNGIKSDIAPCPKSAKRRHHATGILRSSARIRPLKLPQKPFCMSRCRLYSILIATPA